MKNVLAVRLGDVLVGTLRLEEGGLERVVFRTTEQYRTMARRPVLSQALEDNLDVTWAARVRLPAFFSNLLPEGELRELLARRAGVNPAREFFLIAALGEDLPGNVTVAPEGELDSSGDVEQELTPPEVAASEPLRFSLAGLQLKASVIEARGRWTVPVRGSGGRWLLKLPSPQYPGVPRNEFWTMRFAAALGLDVAETRLVELKDVDGLEGFAPKWHARGETHGLLVRRFDRTEGSQRVHVEDLLQVLNKHPSDREKYRAANAEWVGRLVRALDPTGADLDEVVRRLVFNVVMGNGDAHLKNWMLRYADPAVARLAPAFDLVSTIQYSETDQDEFALNLGGSKRYDAFKEDSVLAFARKLQVPGQADVEPRALVEVAVDLATRALSRWDDFAAQHDVSASFTGRLRAHWKRVPFLAAVLPG